MTQFEQSRIELDVKRALLPLIERYIGSTGVMPVKKVKEALKPVIQNNSRGSVRGLGKIIHAMAVDYLESMWFSRTVEDRPRIIIKREDISFIQIARHLTTSNC